MYKNIWKIIVKTSVQYLQTSTTSKESFENFLKYLTKNKLQKK